MNMNTQSRDAEFGFKRTKGNLYNILDEVGAKMQKDLEEFLKFQSPVSVPTMGE